MKITLIGEQNRQAFERYIQGTLSLRSAALGLVEDEQAIGVGVFRIEDDICIIEHLLIDEEYRRRGAATFLLTDVFEVMKKKGIATVMCWYVDSDGGIDRLLSSLGFVIAPQDGIYSFDTTAALDVFKEKVERVEKKSQNVIPMEDLSRQQKYRISRMLDATEYDAALFEDGAYDATISYVYMRNDDPEVFFLAKPQDEDYVITFFYSITQMTTPAIKVMLHFVAGIRDRVVAGSRVHFVSGNDKLVGQMNKMFFEKADFKREDTTKSAVLML